jgi:hypothetical protein
VKSFDEIANPHMKVKLPVYKKKPAAKTNPNPVKLKDVDTEKCQIVPLLAHIFPEVLEHSYTINKLDPMSTYRKILLKAGNLRKELLSLL